MPLTGLEFAVSIASLAVLVLGIVMLNKWRPRAGWWLLAAIVAYIIVVSFVEEAATRS